MDESSSMHFSEEAGVLSQLSNVDVGETTFVIHQHLQHHVEVPLVVYVLLGKMVKGQDGYGTPTQQRHPL